MITEKLEQSSKIITDLETALNTLEQKVQLVLKSNETVMKNAVALLKDSPLQSPIEVKVTDLNNRLMSLIDLVGYISGRVDL